MKIQEIEQKLSKLVNDEVKDEFIYEFLQAYGLPKSSITRLKKGSYDLSNSDNTISWKKKVYFQIEMDNDLHVTLTNLATQIKHDQRFVIVTNFNSLLARDMKTKENLDIPFKDLPKHYDFFLPWAGMEKATYQGENPADVKAAERMAKLFDEIKKDNPDESPEFTHGLNVFLSRLLFCFFAEDTGIFQKGQFTKGVSSHTQAHGSDLNSYIDKLFDVLNTRKSDRADIPAYLNEFPYVNGGLFKDKISSPVFTRRSRQAIIDSGELNWSAINPDIFGSMMQAVITPEHRGGLGMHYTSVPNIMKVIKPLFLDELYEAFEKGQNEPKKLIKLLERISKIKIFDPACGSGNFLIIAYKELRRLEMKIIRRLIELQKLARGFKAKHEQFSFIPDSQLNLAESYQVDLFSRVQLTQFYGIELDDFAHEIAQLSLWLAEHQMNVEFYHEFGQMNPTLPLKEAGKIVRGNACRIDWKSVCPKGINNEVYILGNPPYRGKKEQSSLQKKDLKHVCNGLNKYKNLDFISCWFLLVAEYIDSDVIKSAFVSTNSITQGEQVGLLWEPIFNKRVEIFFAYRSFMWDNNAKKNAGVAVVIIGLQLEQSGEKYLFYSENGQQINKRVTKKISPYLTAGTSSTVTKRSTPLSNIPPICNGSMPNDGGYFFKNQSEYLNLDSDVQSFFKKVIGAREFFHDIPRYTLWIDESRLKKALQFQEIKDILEKVKSHRLTSSRNATRKLAEYPHRYGEVRYKLGNAIIVPGLSAEKRQYIPIGYLGTDTIVTNLAQVIYDAEPWLFGLISSKINNVWVRATSGYFKKDI